jgi:hypothetical protein
VTEAAELLTLARTLTTQWTATSGPGSAQLHMLYAGADPITCGELVSIPIHGMDRTHSDALGHGWVGLTAAKDTTTLFLASALLRPIRSPRPAAW